MISTSGIITNIEKLAEVIDNQDHEYLFRLFVPEFKLNKRMCSPLRKDDTPSFSIFRGTHQLLYHDFKTGETGNIVKFVTALYGINRLQAMRKIVSMCKNNGTIKMPKNNITQTQRTKKEIKVIPIEFDLTDLFYWESFGIRKSTLQKYRVYSLEKVFIDGALIAERKKSQPIYGYYFKNGEWKIYKPFSSQRFLTNTNVLQGYAQLPAYGETLVISKSLKDVMVLSELGIHAVAPHSESVTTVENIEELKKRFKNIVIWFDNDEAGIMGAKRLSVLLSLPYTVLPLDSLSKDISDYYKQHGYQSAKDIAELCLKNASLELV